jgi:hypothetical protein
MAIDGAFRTAMKAAIATALLMLLIFEPLIRGIWRLLLGLSPAFFQYVIDGAYRNAALGKRDWVVAGLAIMFFSFLVAGGVGLVVSVCIPRSLQLARLRRRRDPATRERRRRRERIRRAVVGAIMILSCGAIAGHIFVDLQLNAGFEQRSAVLDAVVSDSVMKQLRAEWAQMKSREDYLRINSQMEQLAKDNNITLPPPLLP